jgi:hypothetical protein
MFLKVCFGSSSFFVYIIFFVNNMHIELNLHFDLGNLEPLKSPFNFN